MPIDIKNKMTLTADDTEIILCDRCEVEPWRNNFDCITQKSERVKLEAGKAKS
jgi:hypothetical protein